MSVNSIIAYEVPTLQPSDTGDRALQLMEDNNLQQLPVIADGQYMALVKEGDLLDWDKSAQPISSSDFLRFSPAIFASAHAYEALRLSYNHNLSVIPVVDNQNKYIGAVTRPNLMNYMVEHSGLDNPGGVIVLEMDPKDYTLYEIARICESEDAIILNSQLFSNRATNKMELTLKVNRTNVEALAATYERFGYGVKEVYGESSNKEDMMDRYNLLMAYLNM
jgi:acetoin utilization protein AcuB